MPSTAAATATAATCAGGLQLQFGQLLGGTATTAASAGSATTAAAATILHVQNVLDLGS